MVSSLYSEQWEHECSEQPFVAARRLSACIGREVLVLSCLAFYESGMLNVESTKKNLERHVADAQFQEIEILY